MATLAPALATLRAQLDYCYPNRSKDSDGWIGDARHQAEGSYKASQHNAMPPDDIVCALDITHDPAHGVDIARLMEELDASNDPRIYYLIANRQIDNSDDSRTKYTGIDPHTGHLHISVRYQSKALYGDNRLWVIPMLNGVGGKGSTVQPAPPAGRVGSSLPDVRLRPRSFQAWYNAYPFRPALLPVISPLADTFGPQSLDALKKVQARYGLDADGICGPRTKELLWNLGWRG